MEGPKEALRMSTVQHPRFASNPLESIVDRIDAADWLTVKHHLNGTQSAILHRIAYRCSGGVNGWCWEPQKDVARCMGLRPETVSRAIADLLQKGVILVSPRSDMNDSHAYRPVWPNLREKQNSALSDDLILNQVPLDGNQSPT